MELIENLTSICPVCNKTRQYKTRRNRDKCSDKPCKACSNSIKRGGTGVLVDKEGNRLCKSCNTYLPRSSYYSRHSTYCRVCSNISTGLYIREVHRYKKYNIAQENYNELLTNQQNSCAICKEKFTEKIKPKIDHDHKTGKVRGLLCHNCNTGLGHFKDNIKFLEATIKYLKK